VFSRRPSPALAVSVIALVVALGGTAVGAGRLLITSSSQVKNGSLTGADLKKGSITGTEIKAHSLSASVLRSSGTASSVSPSSAGPKAWEAYRKSGPVLASGGSATVATLDLAPGVYAVFAKVNLTPDISDPNLLETVFKSNKTVIADCHLNIEGDGDYSAASIQSPGSQSPVPLQMQLTRTLGQPGTAALVCEVPGIPWHAGDASIIAMQLASAPRSESTP
jgi:hypothetical protein